MKPELALCFGIVGLAVCRAGLGASASGGGDAVTSAGWAVEQCRMRFQQVPARWKAGETNFPLISVTWFQLPDLVRNSSVNPAGVVSKGLLGPEESQRGGERMDPADLRRLEGLVDLLPSPSPSPVPGARQILVYGRRSNACFSAVYDRADVPPELEQIGELMAAPIEWQVAAVGSATNVAAPLRAGRANAFVAAAAAPVAISTSADGAQLWDLRQWREAAVSPGNHRLLGVAAAALSPDGQSLVLASLDRVIALEIPSWQTRWVRPNPNPFAGQAGVRGLALLDAGETLAVATSNGLERWSLRTGATQTAFAAGNGPPIRSLAASRDGNALAVLRDGGRVQIWRADWTGAPRALDEPAGARVIALSPDGASLALAAHDRFGERLIVWDLIAGKRREMPARGCRSDALIVSMAWSGDGQWLAVAPRGDRPCVYETARWKPVARWEMSVADGREARLAFAADGTLLALIGSDSLLGLKPARPATASGPAPAKGD